PGAVAGLTTALAKFGTMSLAQVMAPALRYAEEGFVVDSALAASLAGRENSRLIARFAGAATFLPGGKPLAVGTRLMQPQLARTLRRIAERGARGFYAGETARMIADEERRLGGAYQRAFVDRNAKLADPAFVPVPIVQLTDKAYAAKLRATIGDRRATPTPAVEKAMREGTETTHYSVADAQGNAVATTTTL